MLPADRRDYFATAERPPLRLPGGARMVRGVLGIIRNESDVPLRTGAQIVDCCLAAGTRAP